MKNTPSILSRRICRCGCGTPVKTGRFARGHENKAQAKVIAQLLKLYETIDAFGWKDNKVFNDRLNFRSWLGEWRRKQKN